VTHFDYLVHRLGLNDVTYAVGYSAWLDLTPPGVSKAWALERLREQLGVSTAHTVAVGDGNNDLEMLRWAAHSAAMGNAPQNVQDTAREVLGSVEDDGVLSLLTRLKAPHGLAVS
jgi:hydroxymethylpyrimidine pyrophosphatase-like HAD family hydrolase